MKFVGYLAGGSILTAIILSVVSAAAGLGAEKEIWLGMLGPALASVVSWTAVERQRRLNPQKIFKCLIQAFVLKFLFFGAYIVILVKAGWIRPGLFVGCFAFFYLALHVAEAFELRGTRDGRAANDVN